MQSTLGSFYLDVLGRLVQRGDLLLELGARVHIHDWLLGLDDLSLNVLIPVLCLSRM